MALVDLWEIFDRPCGQRLVPSIRTELNRLRQQEEIFVSNEVAEKLKRIGPATIDRALKHQKEVLHHRRKYHGKNNPLIYQRIPVKAGGWDRTLPGQVQIDSVEHCGQSASGLYANTVSCAGVACGWWEGEAVLGSGKERNCEALDKTRKRMPFKWVHAHSDNDRGFINWHLLSYCEAEGIQFSRSTVYYKPRINPYNLKLMHLIDKQYTKTPFYGSRRIREALRRKGHKVNRKRVQRLMRFMGIEAIYPKRALSKLSSGYKIYLYLLRNIQINRVNQVWGTDITYIRLSHGWLYLVAIMDWMSRYVLSWELSIDMDVDFCIMALERALTIGTPEIFNSDQGSQFTSLDFTKQLKQNDIRISMDGRGRAMDNIFNERLWRSVKYEEVYLKDYQNVREAKQGIGDYMNFYSHERPHQSLNYRTPAEVYFDKNK